ncbi:hypothetical protein [Maridesulfovibrio sp.]|uniref:hypothetical protein n=1 Tax=Maridesulfovibrio sp. TaxID=2795000 RepID=UPI0039EF7EB3
MTDLFNDLKKKWPSTIVARCQLSKFSGGLLHPRTMANADSAGCGPENKFSIGRKVAYPVDSVIKWMRDRYEAGELSSSSNSSTNGEHNV